MVVLTALACEYAGHVPVSLLQLLRGLGRRLMSYSRQCISRPSPLASINFPAASIQEVSLLTMIRLAAECQEIPPEPISDVQHLKSKSGRHISHVSVPIYASPVKKMPDNQKTPKPSEMFSV
jgi:AP-4 complex subunit epsilon-1